MYKLSEFLEEQDPTMNVVIVRDKSNDNKLVPYTITINDYKGSVITISGFRLLQTPDEVLNVVYEIMEAHKVNEAKYTDIILG